MGSLIDVSVPIREAMPIWPGNRPVSMALTCARERGDDADVTEIALGAHTGTHVDAPRHFLPGGATAEAIPPEALVGTAFVADLRGATRLDASALDGLDVPDGTERLLLRTSNSDLWASDDFAPEHLRLDASGARVVLDLGLALIGIDYLSIGDEDAHRMLLGAGVVPLEGLDLRGVEAGSYRLICTALRLVGSDGAPARALLEPLD